MKQEQLRRMRQMARKNGSLRARHINPAYSMLFGKTALLRIPDGPAQNGMHTVEPLVLTQFDDIKTLPLMLTHGWRQFPAGDFEVLNP